MPTIPCGTATTPPLCGACPNPATFKCSGCDNMPYCSKACQDGDHAQHTTLCDQFKDFQDEHRPSPDHRRVIFFPQDEERPRFVWLKYIGDAQYMNADADDLERYVPGQRTASGMSFDSHRELNRQYNSTFWMQKVCDSIVRGRSQINSSLIPLLGQYAVRWWGPIICMAPIKYALGTEWEDYDEEDQIDQDILIPYDLDTTSLPVHVGFLRFVARYGDRLCPYGVVSNCVGDGSDP